MIHPLLIEFATPTRLIREQHRASDLTIVGNGPPGTFVVFPHGLRVSLPTDQIVFGDDSSGFAKVAFGGMRFVGVERGQLVCLRVREMHPEARLSPDRSHRMQLDPAWVAAVFEYGKPVWPEQATRVGR